MRSPAEQRSFRAVSPRRTFRRIVPRRGLLLLISGFLLLQLIGESTASQGQLRTEERSKMTTSLLPNQRIAAPFSCPEDTRSYVIDLQAGQYASLKTDRTETLLAVHVFDPSNAEILSLWFPGKYRGADDLSFVADQAGRYRVELSCGREWHKDFDSFIPDSRGTIAISLVATREATAIDISRTLALHKLYRALKVLHSSSRSELETAKVAAANALSVFSGLEDKESIGRAYHVQGLLAYAESEYKTALDCLQAANGAYESNDTPSSLRAVLSLHLGFLKASMGKDDQATQYFNTVAADSISAGDRLSQGVALYWLSLTKRRAHDFEGQGSDVDRAGLLFQEGHSYRWRVRAYLTYYDLSQPEQIKRQLDVLILLSRDLTYLRREIILSMLSLSDAMSGSKDVRMAPLLTALSAARYLKFPDLEWKASMSLVTLLREDGRGGEYVAAALRLAQAQEHHDTRKAIALSASCTWSYRIEICQAASVAARESYEVRAKMAVSLAFGKLFIGKENPVASQDNFAMALRLADEEKDERSRFEALQGLTFARIESRQWDAALESFKSALGISRVYWSSPLFWPGQYDALTVLGKIQTNRAEGLRRVQESYRLALVVKERGNYDEAKLILERLRSLVENARNTQPVPLLREWFSRDSRSYYDLYIDALVNSSTPDVTLAFDLLEQAQARNVLDALNDHAMNVLMLTPQSANLRIRLIQELGQKRLEKIALLTTSTNEIGRLQRLNAAIKEREREVANIERGIPNFAASPPAEPTTAELVRTSLRKEEVLLRFENVSGHLFLWIITPESVRFLRVGENQRARQLIVDFSARWGSDPSSKAAHTIAAQQLGQFLLDEALPMITGRRVIIATTEMALVSVPFAALQVKPEDGSFQSFISQCEILYVPSASMFVSMRNAHKKPRKTMTSIALIGDPIFDTQDVRVRKRSGSSSSAQTTVHELQQPPLNLRSATEAVALPSNERFARLPFANEELRRIGLLLKDSGEVLKLTGFDATVDRVNGLDHSKVGILHFATHGRLDQDQPGVSSIVLSLIDERGSPRYGVLGTTDILKWRLNANLVVLSGCHTAAGTKRPFEGVTGLTEAFLIAGASNVVSSLWQVDDSATAEFMYLFYRFLIKSHNSPAAALRSAQIEMSRHPVYGDPYVWASFVIRGIGVSAN